MYEVELSQNTQKFLDNLDTRIKEQIENSLKRLKNNPIPSSSKFIKRKDKEKIFRYRIGKYRALYLINEKTKIILISKIDKRPRVYD